MKTALIYGATGQDASYLAELLLEKGYRVIGAHRRASVDTFERIQHLFTNPNYILVHSNIADSSSVITTILEYKPDEIYNLAAQSQVRMSFDTPEESVDVTGFGHVNVLNAVLIAKKLLNINPKIYFASSSEQFGSHVDDDGRQRETTRQVPASPYGAAKAYAFNMNKIYRDGYDLHTSSGILFNHESSKRGFSFVTRKITMYLGQVYKCLAKAEEPPKISFGNLNSYRDFGHSKDYVRAMWLMLQQDKPDDYVIATEQTHSIIEFFEDCFNSMCKLLLENERITVTISFSDFISRFVETDTNLFRKCEVDFLRGDCSKAKEKFGWVPEISYQELVDEMVKYDVENINGI